MDGINAITDKIENSNLTGEEKIRFLKLQRCKLLEEIHKKQQLLDQIDYLIIQINKEI
ncbi:MAG: hypothetical protein NC397_05785 [Clostridium sp.]|nr:hypothetical protein [Clostridium sp.]